MKKIAKNIVLTALVGSSIIALSTVSFGQDDEGGFQLPPMPVATTEVAPQALPQYLSGIGRLEAVNQVNLASETTGRISGLHFVSGQTVEAGQVILQIDDTVDRAQLSQLKARKTLAEKQLERAKDLKGLASSEARVDEAQATLDEVKGRIAEVQAEIRKKRVVAPFSGILGIRQVNLGQYLDPGTVLVTLTDTSKFTAIIQLPEQALGNITTGQDADIKIAAFPNEVFKGKLIAIEPQVDRNNHTISVQAYIPEDSGKLRSGLFAEARVTLPSAEQVLMVPETAVERSTYGDTLFIVDTANGTAQRRSVKRGQRRDGYVVIKEGLKEGDTVIVSGTNRVFEGSPVTIKAASASTSVVPSAN